MTERQLRWWWGHYSKSLFSGKIPKPKVICFTKKVHPNIAHTLTSKKVRFPNRKVTWAVPTVWLNPRIEWALRLVLQAIIHEQNHVLSHIKSGRFTHGHGAAFASALPKKAAQELLRLSL